MGGQVHYLGTIWGRLQLGNWGSNRFLLALQAAQDNGWASWTWGIVATLFPCVLALLVKGCCSKSPFEKVPWKRQAFNPLISLGKGIALEKANPLVSLGKGTALEKAIPWPALEKHTACLGKDLPWAVLEKACTKLPWKRQIALEKASCLGKGIGQICHLLQRELYGFAECGVEKVRKKHDFGSKKWRKYWSYIDFYIDFFSTFILLFLLILMVQKYQKIFEILISKSIFKYWFWEMIFQYIDPNQ